MPKSKRSQRDVSLAFDELCFLQSEQFLCGHLSTWLKAAEMTWIWNRIVCKVERFLWICQNTISAALYRLAILESQCHKTWSGVVLSNRLHIMGLWLRVTLSDALQWMFRDPYRLKSVKKRVSATPTETLGITYARAKHEQLLRSRQSVAVEFVLWDRYRVMEMFSCARSC